MLERILSISVLLIFLESFLHLRNNYPKKKLTYEETSQIANGRISLFYMCNSKRSGSDEF